MLYINTKSNDATVNFAIEELITKHIKPDIPALMLWNADKCVMLGNNQSIEHEVDTDYAKKENIQLIRRSSGGGAIYTDLGTVLYTLILPYDGKQPVQEIAKKTVAGMIISALGTMGITAVQEGRNDILLDGRKISGLAQYLSGSHLCTHGSLLYDTDLDTLTNVLIANDEKLLPKGIRSIRSRVTNIKPYMKIKNTTEEFKERIKQALLLDRDYTEYTLSDDEMDLAADIRQSKYASRVWTFDGGTEHC